MKNEFRVEIILIVFALLVLITLAVYGILEVLNPPPIDGYISSKRSHPKYYPATADTPIVYCLGITSLNKQEAASWQVSKEVYDSYNLGDLTGNPTNLP